MHVCGVCVRTFCGVFVYVCEFSECMCAHGGMSVCACTFSGVSVCVHMFSGVSVCGYMFCGV